MTLSPALADIDVHPEVADAVASGRAVVALESTIISHGMPYPTNVHMAAQVEQLVREGGATPATIAIIEGRCTVGVSAEQVELLATRDDVHKATTRDLPWLMATGGHGATTVAATMRLAALAGIRVFATGGVGGVHRGAATTFDVSADLTELATTPVAVVSAGVKSILDIGLTLEHLETLGVPVVVNGSDEFPSFYSRSSGFAAPRRLDGASSIASFLNAAWSQLGLTCGVSIANPIPVADEIPAEVIDDVIADALAAASAAGISGREVTPYLLAAIVDRTDGASLTANLALVRNNVSCATAIAIELAAISARGTPAG